MAWVVGFARQVIKRPTPSARWPQGFIPHCRGFSKKFRAPAGGRWIGFDI